MTSQNEKLMIKAAKKGDAAAVKQLLKLDKELTNARDTDGSTPLHCASWKGHVEVVRVLLDAGADINAKSQNEHYGDTPLHAASHGNQRDVVKVLIERGANLNSKNKIGRTPLGETEWHNATAAAKLLKEAGAV
jgi:ankyrin repeat protein